MTRLEFGVVKEHVVQPDLIEIRIDAGLDPGGQLARPIIRAALRHLGFDAGAIGLAGLLAQGCEHPVLRGEVKLERAFGDRRAGDDVIDAGRGNALLEKEPLG